MTSLINYIKLISEKSLRGNDKRCKERNLRILKIKQRKKEIAKDLAGGHNVGDFTLDPTDISVISRTIETGSGTSMYNLKELYEKYRGK